MKITTCAIDRLPRLAAPALLGLTLLATPIAVRAQDNTTPPPAPNSAPAQDNTPAAPTTPAQPIPPDQSDQSQPTYQGGVPAGTSTPAPETQPEPEQPRHHRLVIGINGGIFVPTSGKARDRFGSTWWSAGIGLGAIPHVSGHGRWNIDLRTQYQSNTNDRHVFVGNLGIEYRRRFETGPDGGKKDFIPYYGISADAVFVDVSSPEDNVQSGINVVPGGSVFVGTNIGRQEFITLGYDAVADVKGFNFSGANLDAGVRF